MAQEFGLTAKLSPDVDEREVEREKDKIDREFEGPLELGAEIDADDLQDAQDEALLAVEVADAMDEFDQAVMDSMSKAADALKSAGEFGVHLTGAKIMRSLGIPATMPTSDIGGMIGRGGSSDGSSSGGSGGGPSPGGSATRDTSTDTAAESLEGAEEILNEQLTVQQDILDLLESDEYGPSTGDGSEGGVSSMLSGGIFAKLLGGTGFGSAGLLGMMGMGSVFPMMSQFDGMTESPFGKDAIESFLKGELKGVFDDLDIMGLIKNQLPNGAVTVAEIFGDLSLDMTAADIIDRIVPVINPSSFLNALNDGFDLSGTTIGDLIDGSLPRASDFIDSPFDVEAKHIINDLLDVEWDDVISERLKVNPIDVIEEKAGVDPIDFIKSKTGVDPDDFISGSISPQAIIDRVLSGAESAASEAKQGVEDQFDPDKKLKPDSPDGISDEELESLADGSGTGSGSSGGGGDVGGGAGSENSAAQSATGQNIDATARIENRFELGDLDDLDRKVERKVEDGVRDLEREVKRKLGAR